MLWLGILCAVLFIILFILIIKIALLRKAACELRTELAVILESDTNNLLTISTRDSHMRRLAEELNKELRKLREERCRFQKGDIELKEAVTNISHDLRTPLTAICGYLDLLEREEKSEAAVRYLNTIKERTQALKQLTEELFRYTVITSVSMDTACEKVVLNQVLEDSILAYYAALKGCRIIPQINIPDKKIERNLNKNALTRIFGNIISNALKYSAGDLKIDLKESGEIIFSNSAPALDEIQVGRLFDRFYTVENAKNSTGLGLSIAKYLTEQMQGTITAQFKDKNLSIQIKFPAEE